MRDIRVKPVLLIAIAVLLAIWLMYPYLRNRIIQKEDNFEFEYYYVDGELVERQ